MIATAPLTVGYAFLNWTEEGGDNHGQMVRMFLKFAANLPEGYPWCMAFVTYAGYWGCYDYQQRKSLWPVPRSAGCQPTYEWAQQQQLVFTTPAPGDIFMIYFPTKKRMAHTGFVTSVHNDGRIFTLEGNTNDNGSREGFKVAERIRHVGTNDRFIRWPKALTG